MLSAIPRRRLANQRLLQPLAGPLDVVRWLGAVQAQDYNAAKWAIAQRSRETTEVELDRLFDDGLILRTHVMRPTWHFVLPTDLRWLLALTAPRVRRALVGRYRELRLDETQVQRAQVAFREALAGGQFLTRPELGQVLTEAGISPEGQRIAHFLMAAELDMVIVSGPRRGKQFTYALFDERVPRNGDMDDAAAAVELARRYLYSHGPAQLRDFVWWSGLGMVEARNAVGLSGAERQLIGEREYWSYANTAMAPRRATLAHLLPNFDEYTVAYADRSAIVDPEAPIDPGQFSYGNILSNVVTLDGRIRGGWRRNAVGDRLRIELRTAGQLDRGEMQAIQQEGARMSRFLGRSVEFADH